MAVVENAGISVDSSNRTDNSNDQPKSNQAGVRSSDQNFHAINGGGVSRKAQVNGNGVQDHHRVVANGGRGFELRRNGDSGGGGDEGFKMRDLEEMLSKLNPMAEEFVPPSLVNNHRQPVLLDGGHLGYINNFVMQTSSGIANGNIAARRKRNSYTNGKRRMNNRTSLAQREEVIRRTVYVSDIDHQVTEEQLAALFVNCGQVVDCRVCGDPNSVLRFAFIEFTDEEGARNALSLAGTMLGYYPVRVLPSKTAIAPVNSTFLPRVRSSVISSVLVMCNILARGQSQKFNALESQADNLLPFILNAWMVFSSLKMNEKCVQGLFIAQTLIRRLLKLMSSSFSNPFVERFVDVYRLRLLGDFHHSTRIAFVEFVMVKPGGRNDDIELVLALGKILESILLAAILEDIEDDLSFLLIWFFSDVPAVMLLMLQGNGESIVFQLGKPIKDTCSSPLSSPINALRTDLLNFGCKMGNCVGGAAADKRHRVLRIVKVDGKILELKSPITVNDLSVNFSGFGVFVSETASQSLPPACELKMGKIYYLRPFPASTGIISPTSTPSAVETEETGAAKRITVVITKQQLQELLSKRISVEDVLSGLGVGGRTSSCIDSHSNCWKPKLEPIQEVSE
ncbi:hypothetical protein RHGRI_008748 [Rhododendron griersonianum]|uniref:RRM domain-containing protein n=1 Tax=Rhododendron griersonianum TaxID=479676 RepID=A0AAV6L1X8_9ERIC|nr:hypothetical protein RHGRI_008748 [Rhododendron griersonianum]